MTEAANSQLQPSWPEDAVEVGRVLDAYGVKGWFKVQPFSRDALALLKVRVWFLRRGSESVAPRAGPKATASLALPEALHITAVRDHGDVLVAQASELSDRNAAEALRGYSVHVSRSNFPPPTADEYYWVDLIGLSVVNLQGETLGRVEGLLDTGPHSVIRVTPAVRPPEAKSAEEAEILIPFVSAYVQDVSFTEARILVDWGLDY